MAVQRLTATALAVVVVAMVAVGCGRPGSSPPPTPAIPSPVASIETVEVPTLIERSRVGAIKTVLKLGLNVRVIALGEPSGKPRDHVVRQVPLAGSRVPLGAEVVLLVYCRPPPCKSPSKGRSIYDQCTCATRS
jgi:beta-lactam-binding protein with PASTA domain